MRTLKNFLSVSAVLSLIFFYTITLYAAEPGTKTTKDKGANASKAVILPKAITPSITETGFISLSLDALGTNSVSGIVQVEKPAGATVRKAFMAAASTGFRRRVLVNGDVSIDGNPVNWDSVIPNSISSFNAFADVTALVKPKIDAAAAGRVDFTITEVSSFGIDGEILAVIFDDPNQTSSNTIVILFGAQVTTGDTFAIALAEPIDKSDPNLALDLSLGISFGFQGTSQFSQIDVNGTRMTTSAGGQDDGVGENGALITVGGLDDSNDNPSDPNALPNGDPRFDDELYNLLPFVNDGDTQIIINTLNPSNDDNIFFAALNLASTTAIVGEGIILSPPDATNLIGTEHTVTATVQDTNGNPIVNREVTFTIISGPHAGLTEVEDTDSNGQATFTYTGDSAGTDVIEASFIDNQGDTRTSNQVTKTWEGSATPTPSPSPTPPPRPCDLESHYTFDEGSGNIAGDSSGNGNDGQIFGAMFTDGKIDGGLSFDGIDDKVSVPVINNDELSIAAWFFRDEVDTKKTDGIFGARRWDEDVQLREGFDLRFEKKWPSTLKFILVTQDENGNRVQNNCRVKLGNATNKWFHVVGTYDKTTGKQKLYINGKLKRTQKHPAGNTVVPLTFYSEMTIGLSGPTGHFRGIIDDVRLYCRPLSEQEVKDLFVNGNN